MSPRVKVPGWWSESTPNKLQAKPWLCQKAIDFFESLLQSDYRVIEHGSGGSTLWLAERVHMVVSCEHDLKWYDAVQVKAPSNAVVMHWTIEQPPDSHPFDLMFIDGEPLLWRGTWIKAAPRLVRKDGYIVLDNANRREYRRERAWLHGKAELLKTITDPGPGAAAFLVTEFYRWHG